MAAVNLEDLLAWKESGGARLSGSPPDAKLMAAAQEALEAGHISQGDYRTLLGLPAHEPGTIGPVEFFRPSDYYRSPKLRPLHMLLFGTVILGLVLGAWRLVTVGVGLMLLGLIYDIHQIRVIHEALWCAIRRDSDPEP